MRVENNTAKTLNLVNHPSCFWATSRLGSAATFQSVLPSTALVADLLPGDFLEKIDPHIRLQLKAALIGAFVI